MTLDTLYNAVDWYNESSVRKPSASVLRVSGNKNLSVRFVVIHRAHHQVPLVRIGRDCHESPLASESAPTSRICSISEMTLFGVIKFAIGMNQAPTDIRRENFRSNWLTEAASEIL